MEKTDDRGVLELIKSAPRLRIETSGPRSTPAPGSALEAIRKAMETPLDMTGRVPLRTQNGRTTARPAEGADANEVELLELRKATAELIDGIAKATGILNQNVKRAAELKKSIRFTKRQG